MQSLTENIVVILVLGMGGMFLLAASFVTIYIRNQKKFITHQEEMQRRETFHQKDLLSAAIHTQDAERKRIGQDLHDDIGASLAALRFTLEMYEPGSEKSYSYERHTNTCKTMIDRILSEVRHISHNLAPAILHLKGLNPALESFISKINDSGKIQIDFNDFTNGDKVSGLTISTSTAFYRVLEELFNNTLKHSKATFATLTLTEDKDNLMIHYADNGIGLQQDVLQYTSGIGFYNIESRLAVIGATFNVEKPLSGFSIRIVYAISNFNVEN